MNLPKKSLGQNFLIDKNITKKIIKLSNIENKHVVEIGPGKGSLTDEILTQKPKSLIIIEKDQELANYLKEKYNKIKKVKVFNNDILKFNIEKITKKNSIIFGNLPYNISSQILVKIIKFKKWPPNFLSLIFMFQKELGDKIIAPNNSKNYGRLSILTSLRLFVVEKFLVSANCFRPRPKVMSMVIYFRPKRKSKKIKNISNLEKITNIFFSNKRKMIKKNIKKILNNENIKKISGLNLYARPSELSQETYYKITQLYEND
jgi:16S rRNA (adenine1518-N6/adenine1519-N6)-dimethyltransferase